MSDIDRDEELTTLRRAVVAFGDGRFLLMAGNVAKHLQEMDAVGHFEDFHYKTLWDEYCHEVQHGPFADIVDWAWETLLAPLCRACVERIPDSEKALLFFSTNEYESLTDDIVDVPIDDDALTQELLRRVHQLADERRIDRLDGSEGV